jgi:hypothetical protein
MVTFSRVKNFKGWMKTIHFLIKNRGRNTYGYYHINGLIERYIHENSRTLADYQAAEAAINQSIKTIKTKNEKYVNRIGPEFDAGYVGKSRPLPTLLISGGAGKNIDFELELAQYGVEVHIFDHTLSKLPKQHENIVHHRNALCGEKRRIRKSISLQTTLEVSNQRNHQQIWLKLDIEGDEWALLAENLEVLGKFEQVFIEFHDTYKLSNATFRDDFTNIFQYLNSKFDLISISSNNWQGMTNFGKSFIPTTFEVTFVKKNKVKPRLPGDGYKKYLSVNNQNRLAIPSHPFRAS